MLWPLGLHVVMLTVINKLRKADNEARFDVKVAR